MTRRTFAGLIAASRSPGSQGSCRPRLAAGCYVWIQHYGGLGRKLQELFNAVFAGFQRAGFADWEPSAPPGLDASVCNPSPKHVERTFELKKTA